MSVCTGKCCRCFNDQYDDVPAIIPPCVFAELFLIIHNIDGMTLRASHVQNILSKMASTSKIYVIASIDHINAPLSKYYAFSFLSLT